MCWDDRGCASKWSAAASFGTGLLREEDWRATWIASDLELTKRQQELRRLPDFGMETESEAWRLAETPLKEPGPDEAPGIYIRNEFAINWFATIMSQAAALMGPPDEALAYSREADEIRAAYNREFLDPATGRYATGSQTAQLVSLVFGLVPNDMVPLVRRRLMGRIANDDFHLSTGFVGTPLLLTGLSEMGMPGLAWRIGTQPGAGA